MAAAVSPEEPNGGSAAVGGESAATFALANEVKAVALSAKDAGDPRPPPPLPKPSPPPAQAMPKEESRSSHEQVT